MSQPRSLRSWFDEAVECDEAGRADCIARARQCDATLGDELERLLDRQLRDRNARTRDAMPSLPDVLRYAARPAGDRAGPYTLHEELGAGGMGRVYRAHRGEGALRQEVAVKLMRRERMHPSLRRRFEMECQALTRLEHPGICRLLETGELDDGTPWVAMAMVRGSDICTHCDAQRLTIDQRLKLFRQVLAAIEHAHRNLIVHRDIKPGNVMVDGEGRPHLLDFGIAKLIEADDAAAGAASTATAERMFTPAHAAPEQILGLPVSVACDVYGLGTLLYELLCGRPPFPDDGLTPGEQEHRILHLPPPRISEAARSASAQTALARNLPDPRHLAAQLAGDLDLIVQRCLRKQAHERYPNVDQLDGDIAHWLQGRPISGRLNDRWYRMRKFVARNRLAVALTAGAFLGLSVTLLTIAWQAHNLAIERDRVAAERDRAEQALVLLRDAFVSADPAQVAGVDVTARQILQSAASKVSALRDSQPLLFASLVLTIAEVRFALGDVPGAAKLAAEAALAARSDRESKALLHRALTLRGAALVTLGDIDAAGAALNEAGSELRDDPAWMVEQARWLRASGNMDAATALLDRCKALIRSREPPDVLATRVRMSVAETWRARSDFAQALREFDDILAWQHGRLADEHPQVLQTRVVRTFVLQRLGRVKDALAESLAIAGLVEHHYGKNSAQAARAQAALGGSLRDSGNRTAAIAAHWRSIAAWEASMGADHSETLRAVSNLASMLAADEQQRDLAERLHRRAMVSQTLRYGPQSPLAFYFRVNFATYLLRLGRHDEVLGTLISDAGFAGLPDAAASNQQEYMRVAREAGVEKRCAAASIAPGSTIAEAADFRAQCRGWAEVVSRYGTPVPQGSLPQ